MVKNSPFLIRNLTEDKKQQARDDFSLLEKINELQNELDFYKSIFKRRTNSAIFNLRIKTINGQRIWYDKVMDHMDLLHLLDEDEEVIEWKKPVSCER